MYVLVFALLLVSVNSLNDQCDAKIFILISSKTIFLVNFDSQNDYPPSIIYQAKFNTTIDDGLFNKRTNTIILLINQSNTTFSIFTLNVDRNIYENWLEKSNQLSYSSSIHLSLGQRYLYLLNNQTMLLQIFTLPLTSTALKQNYLSNLPTNQLIVSYLVDEKLQFLWILLEQQLYICYLKLYSCQLYMNIFDLNPPVQFLINWNSQQFYLYSKDYLLIFDYNSNRMNYSIEYFNATHERFLSICEEKNLVEYISITNRQVCSQTCQNLPSIINTTNRIHTIQRLGSPSNILYCFKQRRMSRIILLILILIDLTLIISAISWFAYKYIFHSTLDQSVSNGAIWTSEKELITHF